MMNKGYFPPSEYVTTAEGLVRGVVSYRKELKTIYFDPNGDRSQAWVQNANYTPQEVAVADQGLSVDFRVTSSHSIVVTLQPTPFRDVEGNFNGYEEWGIMEVHNNADSDRLIIFLEAVKISHLDKQLAEAQFELRVARQVPMSNKSSRWNRLKITQGIHNKQPVSQALRTKFNITKEEIQAFATKIDKKGRVVKGEGQKELDKLELEQAKDKAKAKRRVMTQLKNQAYVEEETMRKFNIDSKQYPHLRPDKAASDSPQANRNNTIEKKKLLTRIVKGNGQWNSATLTKYKVTSQDVEERRKDIKENDQCKLSIAKFYTWFDASKPSSSKSAVSREQDESCACPFCVARVTDGLKQTSLD